MGLNGSLDGIVAELNTLLERAEWVVLTTRTELEEAQGEVNRLKSILRAADAKPKEKKERPRKVQSERVNEETRASVLNAIHLWVELGTPAIPEVRGSFTAMDLEEYTPIHSSSVRKAISNLRDDGILRAVGLKPGTPRRAPMVYALGEGNEASK
jgi:hypothetical protein